MLTFAGTAGTRILFGELCVIRQALRARKSAPGKDPEIGGKSSLLTQTIYSEVP